MSRDAWDGLQNKYRYQNGEVAIATPFFRMPFKQLIKIDVHEHADFKELVISSDTMRDIVSVYVREKSVTVVKERNGEMLKAQTFGAGCLQVALEWMQHEEPETAKEINERMKVQG